MAVIAWLGVACTLLALGKVINSAGLVGAAGIMVLMLAAVESF